MIGFMHWSGHALSEPLIAMKIQIQIQQQMRASSRIRIMLLIMLLVLGLCCGAGQTAPVKGHAFCNLPQYPQYAMITEYFLLGYSTTTILDAF